MPVRRHPLMGAFSSDPVSVHSTLNDTSQHPRNIRSFVRREGRFSKAQQQSLAEYWPKHGIDYQPGLLDIDKLFGRRAPLIVDIGVGNGDSTFHHALNHPENNYLAIEVHRPGIGQLLNKIEKHQLTNIKIISHDTVDVFSKQLPAQSATRVFIFFPDPWPKKRHHKRRLINQQLLSLIKTALKKHGCLHIATDWDDYAGHIHALFEQDNNFINLAGKGGNAPRPLWRAQTRYESRGIRLEHKVWDFCYCLA